MKKNATIIIALLFIAAVLALAVFASQYKDLNIPIKKVYAEPNEKSKVIFEIPIEVKALGVSADRSWFKVKIKIDLVFFGNYEYVGWVYIPIASLLKENASVSGEAEDLSP